MVIALRKIGVLGRTYRHIQRYRQVIAVLLKHGFRDTISALNIDRYLDLGLDFLLRREQPHHAHLSREERIRMAIEELGPVFVKVGQFLSTRPDLLPAPLIRELEKLQDAVQPFPFEEARAIVESELKRPLKETFEFIEEKPLASASVAQVHRARLRDGDDVVLKIRRPDIRRVAEVDLEIMLHIAGLMERFMEGMEFTQPTRLVEEFAHTIEQELDFTIEAANQERFARQFSSNATVYVPKVHHDLTTPALLTMETVEGLKLTDHDALKRAHINRRELARRGYRLTLEQVFVHGFFHADPHPGNLVALPGNVIGCLDFGMMGRLDEETRLDLGELVARIVARDEERVAEAVLKLADAAAPVDSKLLRRDVCEFLDRHVYGDLGRIRLGPLFRQLFEVLTRHRLRIHRDLLLMIKALSVIEEVGKSLDPDLALIEAAAPFVAELQAERSRPLRLLRNAASAGVGALRTLADLPKDLQGALRQLRDGRLKLELHQQGIESMMSTYDRVSNRISFAIVLGSLLIGSSLVVLAGVPPKWRDLPVIGVGGFAIAGAMSLWLLVSILRRGRM